VAGGIYLRQARAIREETHHDRDERRRTMTEQTPTGTASSGATTAFSTGELRHLSALREHYQHTRDLFGAREVAYLRFVRWLYHTGRVVP